jgi:hypothetical protein
VTSDSNFHAAAKRDKLKELGAGTIEYPVDALNLANNHQLSGGNPSGGSKC